MDAAARLSGLSAMNDGRRVFHSSSVIRHSSFLLLAFVLLLAPAAFAAPTGETVRAIEIAGNKKMRTSRVLQYMDTKVGGPFDPDVLTRDVERIRSWMYFDYVRPTVVHAADGARVRIELQEKLTIIPDIDVQYGGGAYMVHAGIKDTNFLGYRQEVDIFGGFRAGDWLAGAHFIEPRIAGTRFGVRVEALRVFYADPLYLDARARAAAYESVVDRMGGELRLEREFSDLFRLGVAYGYTYDRTRRSPTFKHTDRADVLADLARDGDPNAEKALFANMVPHSTAAYLGAWMKAGRIAFDDYIFRGWSLESTFRHYDPALGGSTSFERFLADFRFYVPVPGRMNATARLMVGAENSPMFLEQFTLGGLDTLRGYPDRRFRGRDMGVLNVEYRWIPGSWWWFTFMFVALADAGITSNGAGDPLVLKDDFHASAGAGFRWIIHKWDNAVVRGDVAWPLTGRHVMGFTVGVDMFF